jgi:hypothetical protein
MRRHKKTFPCAWKVNYGDILQHLLPPYLLSLAGPFLKVILVNHRYRDFVNLSEIRSIAFSLLYSYILCMPADTVFSLILGPDIHRDLRGETDSERILGGFRWISERI